MFPPLLRVWPQAEFIEQNIQNRKRGDKVCNRFTLSDGLKFHTESIHIKINVQLSKKQEIYMSKVFISPFIGINNKIFQIK